MNNEFKHYYKENSNFSTSPSHIQLRVLNYIHGSYTNLNDLYSRMRQTIVAVLMPTIYSASNTVPLTKQMLETDNYYFRKSRHFRTIPHILNKINPSYNGNPKGPTYLSAPDKPPP